MEIRCLGPMAVVDDGRQRPLGGPKQRLVLAHLVIRANRVVPIDRLIDEVWDGDPPPAARGSLHSYISHLRHAVGADRIDSTGAGYALRGEPEEVDLLRFEALVAQGRRLRTTDPARAAASLHEALDLWRGSPFADLPDAASLRPEITRLTELRLAAIEDRVGADLDAGSARDVVGELEALIAEHPLREGLWGLLIVALYRSGRQADALQAYERARRLLADELGIDPSEQLRSLHERILRQDPSLHAVTATLRGYRLLERLGEGTFGVVWRATQPGVDRDVAIKVARPELANDPVFIRRFETEAQRIARIEHPHVVPLYDFWREPDGAYLVMRYVRGGNLATLLDRAGSPGRAAALRIAEQIAEALAAAHQLGVVHGDLTPSNVLLDEQSNAYLADFGVAGAGVMPHLPPSAGGRRYLSPERIDGQDPDARADVYAFGVLLAELLSDADAAVTAVARRATSKEADRRPPDGLAVLTSLRSALDAGGPAQTPGFRPAVLDGGASIRNPYKGLRAFVESDAVDFFGRDVAVAQLLARVREYGDGGRFLAVVGPSGSGKSSVVRAGLVPALRAGALDRSAAWFIVQMVPSDRPFGELATALRHVALDAPDDLATQLADADHLCDVTAPLLPDDAELLVVIDQFEELFTLTDDDRRRRFIDRLVDAATDNDSHIRVVVTLRADFYDRPLEHPRLGTLTKRRTEALLPLSAGELERAITGPAERVGVAVERRLVAQMVADVADQPGALPLLQYALTELFDNRRDATLTAEAYREIGGIAGALSRRAETIYAGLGDDACEAARQLFLRLLTPGEGVDDTRRRALVADVTALAPNAMPDVLDAFGDARLLSFDRDPDTRAPTVEVAHEALLREWRRLRAWFDAARDDLRTHRRLQTAAADWAAADHDPSYLATGSQLAQYEAWRDASGITASDDEDAYVDASVAARDRAAAEEAARQRRERELERRSVRRLRILVAVLGIAALVAGGLTVFATGQARRAADQTLRAEREARVATARELSAAADANIDVDPERSMLLAIEAINTTRNTDGTALREAEEALHRAVHTSRVTMRVSDVGGGLDWSPDGETFVTEGPEDAGVIDIRDTATGASVRSWRGHDDDVNDVIFSSDGTMLLTVGDDGALRVWDPTTADVLAEHVTSGEVWGPAFSPDGSLVAAVWLDADVLRVIDVANGAVVAEVEGLGAPRHAFRTAFSPDGREIAVPSWGRGRVVIYDTATGAERRAFDAGPSTGVAWSPDGRWVAVFEESDADAYIFDAQTGEPRHRLSGHSSDVRALDWTSDATRLATSSVDGTVRIWDVLEGGAVQTLTLTTEGMSGGILGVAFSPDDTEVMAGDEGITRVMTWNVDQVSGGAWPALPIGDPGEWTTVVPAGDDRHVLTPGRERAAAMWDPRSGQRVRAYGGDEPAVRVAAGGEMIAAVGDDNVVTAWNAASGQKLFAVDLDHDLGGVSDMDISADGQFVATTSVGGPIRIFDTAGAERAAFDATLDPPTDVEVLAVALSPDASLVTAAELRAPDNTGRVTLWDVERGTIVRRIDARANNLTFNHDGTHLAIAQRDGVAIIRDVRDATTVSTLRGHAGPVSNAVFDADGSTVATTGVDGTVRLWDAATAEPRVVLPGHDIASLAAVFTDGGDTLTSVGRDGVGRTWALDVDNLIALAERELTRGLTEAECREYLRVDPCPSS